MIIDSAAIKLQGQHQQQQQTKRTERLEFWANRPADSPARPVADKLDLSVAAAKAPEIQSRQLDLDKPLDAFDNLVLQIIRRMVKAMTGHDFKLFSPEDLRAEAERVSFVEPQPPPAPSNAQGVTGMGLVYERTMSYSESETTTFNAEGSILTKDGRSIAFSVSLNMSRSFSMESTTSIRLGEAAKKTDPLVINFDGNAAELSSTRFEFDIDANGSLEQIAILKPGSGLLALDRNQDGMINDGSELFGPGSGDGFAELAAYDDDGNQFIDEGDAIYQQLRIWQRFEDGSQKLVALGDKNIGMTLYLGHVGTPFQLKTAANASLGEIASSGIYLTEDGGVGTVQQINFTA